MNEQTDYSTSMNIHRKPLAVYVAASWMLILISIGLLAPLIANELPLYVHYKGKILFPAFSIKGSAEISSGEFLFYRQTDWKNFPAEKIIFPLIPYSPGKSDPINDRYVSPFGIQKESKHGELININWKNRHWLGTNRLGADVLSGLIHGIRFSLSIGIFSMLLAGLLGIGTGLAAGYFGDAKIRLSRNGLISILIGLIPGWFYTFYIFKNALISALNQSWFYFTVTLSFLAILFIFFLYVFYRIGKMMDKFRQGPLVNFPLDILFMRVVEIFSSVPKIIFIITIAAFVKPSVGLLILIIGLFYWTEIARVVRAEMLRIRSMPYMESAELLGIPTLRLLLKHALPNAIGPALVLLVFGIASAIIAESSLSFLGIGIPPQQVSWGTLLWEGRSNFYAWWLVVFPGLAIFLTVFSINILAEYFQSEK